MKDKTTMADFNVNLPPLKLEFVPAILAFILVTGLFGILFVLMFHELPDKNRDTFNIVFGAVSGSVGTAVAFYFGSSKSTQTKDATIAAVTKTLTENAAGSGDGKDNINKQ